MAKKYINEKIVGSYFDIIPNESKLFNITLETNVNKVINVTKKEEKIIEENYDFTILIDAGKIVGGEDKNLTEKLKDVTSSPYIYCNPYSKTYKFYTNRYSKKNIDEKKELLNNIFNCLNEYEKNYEKTLEKSREIFQKDAEVSIEYHDNNYIVKYIKDMDKIVVVALSFLDKDKYRVLANASVKKGKVVEELTNYVGEFMSYENKTCFIIYPERYIEIKEIIEQRKKEKNDFIEEQQKYIKEYEKEPFEYSAENIFNFKIIPQKEMGVFEFYCKGAKEQNTGYGYRVPYKNTIPRWAFNYILARKTNENENREYIQDLNHGREKINLKEADIKKQRDAIYVPFSEIKNLREIYQNFLKENAFWEKEKKNIKIKGIDVKSLGKLHLDRFPAIYFAGKDAYLTYSYRTKLIEDPKLIMNENGEQKYTNGFFDSTMTGIKLSYNDVVNFLTNHEDCDEISKNTFELNAQIYLIKNHGGGVYYTDEEKGDMYEKVYSLWKLNNLAETHDKKEIKKNKI